MISFSTRARVIGSVPDAVAWAVEIAGVVTKATGVPVNVATRFGGHFDILWVSQFENMSALEAMTDKIAVSKEYDASVRGAIAKGFFDQHSIEQAVWRSVP